MIVTKAIETAPQTYAEWLVCFEVLERRPLRPDERMCIRQGRCTDTASLGFLEEQLVKTVNGMLSRITRTFRRDVELYTETGSCEELYSLFRALAVRFRDVLFFEELAFLPLSFREELADSVKREVQGYWDGWLRSLKASCMETGDYRLEDQLFMIHRITLFTS